MGLLDDAIREHLELKRIRGADPSEVIRQEREALGAQPRQETAVAEADDIADDAFEPEVADPGIDPEGAPEADVAPDPSVPVAASPSEFAHADDDAEDTPTSAGTSPRPALDQDTAEVDMQAMLGVEDEELSVLEGDERDPHEPDPDAANEPWGEP